MPEADPRQTAARRSTPTLGSSILYINPIYFFPHFVSRMSPIVPPEIVSPSTGLPRKMILVFSWYSFWPNLFQVLHGASMRHSLNVLAVQVKVCLGPSSAKLGTAAPINNTSAINTVECSAIRACGCLMDFSADICPPHCVELSDPKQIQPSAIGTLNRQIANGLGIGQWTLAVATIRQ